MKKIILGLFSVIILLFVFYYNIHSATMSFDGVPMEKVEKAVVPTIPPPANTVWKTNVVGVPDWREDAIGVGGEAFPVGSVFICVVSANPATLLGYGTWVAIDTGRLFAGLNDTIYVWKRTA